MNGRQDFPFDRSHLVTSSMPGGLIMAAGNYGELPTPFILPTSNGVLRSSMTDLNRAPLTLGLTSSHQQYHGRCNSSFSWNTGTHFSSLVNGFNFGSVSSSISPFHSSSAVHNVGNGWPPVAPNSEGVGHYCMASGFCSLFPLVSGNEMYNSLSSSSSMCSRFSPFQQSFHHICHNSKDVVLSSGIQLDTMMAYPQHISSTTTTLRNLTEDQNNSSMYFSKGFESSSCPRGDLWSDSPKSINSDGNNNNTNVCVNANEVQLINKHSKLPEISGNKKMRFEKVTNNVEISSANFQKVFEPTFKKGGEQNIQSSTKHETSQKKRKNSMDVNLLNSKQKLLSAKFINDHYSESNNQDNSVESEGSNNHKNKKKNQGIEPLFLERKLLIKKDSNDRWGIQPQNVVTDDAIKTSATTTTTATATSTTSTTTTITTTIIIPYTTTSTTTTASTKEVLNDYSKIVPVPPTPVMNKALDLSGHVSKSSDKNFADHMVENNKHRFANNSTSVKRNTSIPLTLGITVPSQAHLASKGQLMYSSPNATNKTPPSNKKIKILTPKSKNVQHNSQVVTNQDTEFKTTLTNGVCISNTTNCKVNRNKSCIRCKIDLKQAKKTALCTVVEPTATSLSPVLSPISTSSSSSVVPTLSAQITSPPSSLLSSSSSSLSSISTPPSSSSISPSYSTIAEDLWKASESTPDTQCEVCDHHPIKPNTKADSESQQIKSSSGIQPKTAEVIPLKKLKIVKGDTLILKPNIQNTQPCKISKDQRDLPSSSKTVVSEKRSNQVLFSVENKTVSSFKTRGKSLSCSSKANISEKTIPTIKMNIQKVQPIPVSSECALQLSAPCNFTSVTEQPLSISNPPIQYPVEHQPPKAPFNSATIITVPVNTNCISSSTSVTSPSNELQPTIGVCPPATFSVQTVPKPLTSAVPLTPASVPIDNLNLSDANFLQTNKITQFESELKDNITVAQVLPVNVVTSNTCDKSVPMKMSEQLTENSVLLQNPTVSVNIPIGIAVARQRQEQTTTQTTSLVASGAQWEENSRTSASISPPWITSSHTSTYWLPQGQYAASTTAPFPLQFNSPDLTHLSFPPVGFQLVRDSVTGHLLLIPTNIDITDRTNIWPAYGTTATQLQSSQQCQQLMIQQPILQQDQHQPLEYRISVPDALPTTEITKTRATEIQTDEHDDISAISNGEISSAEKIDEKEKSISRFTGTSDENNSQHSIMNNVSTSIDESYSFNYQSDSTLPYMYGSSGVLQFAQAVQTDSGKRSQGTSPLPNDDCLPTCMEQVAQTSEDINSCGTYESTKLGPDCETTHSEPQVADASNQTETPPLTEEEDNEMENSPINSTIPDVETDHESISKQDTTVINSVVENNNVKFANDKSNDIVVNSKSETQENDVIDVHGLQLLSNSIMEHEENLCDKISEIEKPIDKVTNKSEYCNAEIFSSHKSQTSEIDIQISENASQNILSSNPPPKTQTKISALKLSSHCLGANSDATVPDSLKGLEGLGLLCALAEQRFVEENWSPKNNNSKVELQNEPLESPVCETTEPLSENTSYDFDNELSSQDISLILNDDINAVDSGENSSLVNKVSVADTPELEMRLRLAELQKKYKEKQRQLAKLQPKKEKEECEKVSVKRGPGRPRKHKFSGFRNLEQQTNSVVTTFVKLEASPPLLETALDEPPVKKQKEETAKSVRHFPSILSPLFNKVIKKSIVKTPLIKTKMPRTTLASYLKKLKLRKAKKNVKLTKEVLTQNKNEVVPIKNVTVKESILGERETTEKPDNSEVPQNSNHTKGTTEKKKIFMTTNKEDSFNKQTAESKTEELSTSNKKSSEETFPTLQPTITESMENYSSEKHERTPLTGSSELNQEFSCDNSGGLGLLANFVCHVVKETNRETNCLKITSSEHVSSAVITPENALSPKAVSSCVSSSFASKKRKPGRPKKPFHKKSENTSKDITAEKKSKKIKAVIKKHDPSENSRKQESTCASDNSQPKLSFLEDEAWNRRRSERIFLNDSNISLATIHSETNNKLSSSPPHLKPVTEELPVWRAKTSDNLKPPKHLTRAPDITKISKKSLKGDSSAVHNSTTRKNQKDSRKTSKDYSESENQFQDLKEKSQVNNGTEGKNSLNVAPLETPEDNLSFISNEILPENETEERPGTPEPRSCLISSDELVDKLRVLALIDGLFYAGHINAIQAPDVYGITFDGERGNRPHIYSREEILKKAILEIKPGPIRYLSEGTRICAYWSQQYRCLYPGTVMKSTSPDPEADENSVYVEFDDGDSGRIPISDIRMLHSTFPIVSYGPSPLVYTGKRRFRTASEKSIENGKVNEGNEKEKQKSSKVIEIESKATGSYLPSTLTKDVITSSTLSTSTIGLDLHKTDENISTNIIASVTPLIISSKKNEEGMKKKIKKIKTVLKQSKLLKESEIDSTSSTNVFKSKKHKKHKDRSRSEEHRHHHHHHHHKHKHKHDRYEMHKSSGIKLKNKEINNMKIIKTTDSSKKALPTVINSPTFTAEWKKSELTVKIRTNSTDLSHLEYSSKGDDSETQSMWDVSEVDKSNCINDGSNKEEMEHENLCGTREDSQTKKLKIKKNNKVTGVKRKKRPPSVESKSKMAAFLPARQLWRWAGNSFRRPGTKGKGRKKFYKAITRGKETIVVGDSAVFLSTGRPHLPYIGRIEMMWEAWGGNMVVRVKWFYHPEETKGGRRETDLKGALYQSPHVDENDVQTISHKCEVLSWENYNKMQQNEALHSSKYGNIFDNNDIYYLAGTYDPTTGMVVMEPNINT